MAYQGRKGNRDLEEKRKKEKGSKEGGQTSGRSGGESREKWEARRRIKERYGYHDPLDSFYVYNLLTFF